MIYKQLAKTSTRVSAIGQGTTGTGSYNQINKQRDTERIRVLRRGIELGMNFIDTAELYGGGHAEELVGKAIKGIRRKVFVASKFNPEHATSVGIKSALEASLKRLKTDYLNLYQVHWSNPSVNVEETISTSEALLKEGKIRNIGVCNFTVGEFEEARRFLKSTEIVSNQVEYSLFDRSIETDILPYNEKNKITTIAYSPLNQGRLNFSDKKMGTLLEIAKKYDKTIIQLILNWLISHPSVIVIFRTTSINHLLENAGSIFKMDSNDRIMIDKLFAQKIIHVPTQKIRITPRGNKPVYVILKEAIENKLDFIPSPVSLAENILKWNIKKPIHIVKTSDKSGKYEYDLVDGMLRYWAWIIAYKNRLPIPAYEEE